MRNIIALPCQLGLNLAVWKYGSMEEVKDGRMEEVKDDRMEVALNGWAICITLSPCVRVWPEYLLTPLSLCELIFAGALFAEPRNVRTRKRSSSVACHD